MTQSIPPRFVVLAAIDDSALADPVAAAAARYAKLAHGAELHFVHVVTWVPTSSSPAERLAGVDASSLLEAARVKLDAVAKKCGFEGSIACHLALGDTAREVLQMAARVDADIVFVGTHGRTGVKRALLGSVAERVVRGASCPVLVIRDKDYHLALAPEIEPACPDCLAKQKATHGKTLWCDRHSESHPKAHLHYELVEGFGAGSMLVKQA